MGFFKALKNGIIDENPTFVQVLGMCPTLATTTSAMNGLGMGLSATVVLALSNLLTSLLRKIIPSKIRIPIFVVVIASFVTVVQFCLEAFVPPLYDALGLFIPLIVVNCIILARAEGFAYKNPPLASFGDGLGNGLGFTLALSILGAVREILGNGSIFGIDILGKIGYQPALIMILPPGAFLALGLLLAGFNKIKNKK
ncbi:electron transport complex subunit RsxE [Peptoanaerobacter stomatis]|uniref:Ion-translocating oxidoreductase complex subunit E n=1 Tax=Peptoanaerobacter stomatis TaxID=796937 RepID=G9XBN8_9FIRM|nr:electron transport complex subunit E [Peptoanaerobacter stomatis]EHL16410.1 hypothetical protein HMPREF9629_01250 [Peptoanaerobacter stomatis]EHL19593.1 hypothetical protein HMPREF9628_01405 [Peptoanaerobacter stomatis]